jgi:hypothetical protein
LFLIGCGEKKKKNDSTLNLIDLIEPLNIYSKDGVLIEWKDQKYKAVDSIFYNKYILPNSGEGLVFRGRFHDSIGISCEYFYFGKVSNLRKDLKQVLILESFLFNGPSHKIFLMTFNNEDALTSALPVALDMREAEVISIDRSIFYEDSLIRFETSKSGVADTFDSVRNELLYERDSNVYHYSLKNGKYVLLRRDTLRFTIRKPFARD